MDLFIFRIPGAVYVFLRDVANRSFKSLFLSQAASRWSPCARVKSCPKQSMVTRFVLPASRSPKLERLRASLGEQSGSCNSIECAFCLLS